MRVENSVRETTCLSRSRPFEKSPLTKRFLSTLTRKASVFKLLWFEERFRKAQLSWHTGVDVRHNGSNKAAFLNFSGVLYPGAKLRITSYFEEHHSFTWRNWRSSWTPSLKLIEALVSFIVFIQFSFVLLRLWRCLPKLFQRLVRSTPLLCSTTRSRQTEKQCPEKKNRKAVPWKKETANFWSFLN